MESIKHVVNQAWEIFLIHDFVIDHGIGKKYFEVGCITIYVLVVRGQTGGKFVSIVMTEIVVN